MSIQQSCLYDTGFDVVVASTPKAMNATLKQYIHEFGRGASPVITAYFVMDDTGNITEVPFGYPSTHSLYPGGSYGGIDPLTIPAWDGTGAKPAAISALEAMLYNKTDAGTFPTMPAESKFCYAISFQLGFPGGNIPGTDILTLTSDGKYLQYKLCFQNFSVVVANYPSDMIFFPIYSYESYVQTSKKIYEFTVNVPLTTINANTSNIPSAVANQAVALGAEFTLQQLVLDLDNAAWYEGAPTITDAPAGSKAFDCLTNHFLPIYAQVIDGFGKAALGYHFIPAEATSKDFTVTNVQLQIDNCTTAPLPPAVPTLDYLCAVNNNPPRLPVEFSAPQINGFDSWNWFDAPTTAHGLIAINPVALATYFSKSILPYVETNCYIPSTSWTKNKQSTAFICALPTVQAGQTPQIKIYDGEGPLLSFSYTSAPPQGYSTQDTLDENNMKVTYTQQLTTSFDLTVDSGPGNTMVITQHLVMYYHVSTDKLNAFGNIVDKTIVDTYTLVTNPTGQYAPAVTSNTTDKSQNLDQSGIDNLFSGGFNTVLDQVQTWATKLANTSLTDIPAADLQGLIFPGGNAFAINAFEWSNNKDLVSTITYAAPAYITN